MTGGYSVRRDNSRKTRRDDQHVVWYWRVAIPAEGKGKTQHQAQSESETGRHEETNDT